MIPRDVTIGSVQVEHFGPAGALTGRIVSHSENLTYGFYVQMDNHGSGSISGAYWSLVGDMNSLLTVQNVGEEEDKVTIELAYNGGSFRLAGNPSSTEGGPDSQPARPRRRRPHRPERRTFPCRHALEGGYRITSSNPFTGKLVTKEQILSPSGQIAMPFYSVCDYVTALYFNNAPSTITLSISQSDTVYPVCDWNYGTTAAPDASVWVANTSKATVSPSWGSSRTVTAVNVGQTSLQSTADAPEQIGPDECEPSSFTAPAITIVVEIVDLKGSVPNPPVTGDGEAVITNESFTLQVEAVHPTTGQRITTYNGSATVSLSSPVSGDSVSPNPVTLTNGVGTTSVKLKGVSGTSKTRTYTISGTPLAPFTGAFNVWFKVSMNVEFWENCDGPTFGSYKLTTACAQSGLPANSNFMALPNNGSVPCNTSIKVRNRDNGTVVQTQMKDRGPSPIPRQYWNSWNGGNVPIGANAGDVSDGLAIALGIPYKVGTQEPGKFGCPNPIPNNPPNSAWGQANILWRFGL